MSLERVYSFCEQVLELIDDYIFRMKNKNLKVKCIRLSWAKFSLGSVRIKGRHYIDEEGKRCYFKEGSIFLTTLLPFMKCAEIMDIRLPQAEVSHAMPHRTVGKVTKVCLQANTIGNQVRSAKPREYRHWR
jgi:hypothetical protein